MSTSCCNVPAACCCVGEVDKKPGEVIRITLDLCQWVDGGGTILTGPTDFAVSVWDVTDDTAAPAAPAGVGMVANSVSTGRNEEGDHCLLHFGIEGGTSGHSYRLDFTARVRDCNGFVETIENCVMVRVVSCQ